MNRANWPATGLTHLATTLQDLDREHQALESLLGAHLDRLIAGDFAAALACFDVFAMRLREHLAREESVLFPALATVPAPRWSVQVYLAEHDRLRLLLNKQRGRLAGATSTPVADPKARRTRSLSLLDAAHSLRHVLEHHQQRETGALFVELAGHACVSVPSDPAAFAATGTSLHRNGPVETSMQRRTRTRVRE